MKSRATRRSLAWLLVTASLSLAGYTGCDGGGDGDGDEPAGVASAACSSCQEAYTLEDCKAWGELAGCEVSELTEENTCEAGLAGCAFTNCKGAPICNDAGSSECADCGKSLSQADCDAIAESAGCESATVGEFLCETSVMGCTFLGCDFTPSCE